MGELAQAIKLLSCELPTVIRQINHPIHNGKPNPAHGKFHFVGTVPAEYVGARFDTEQAAIDAALSAGVTHLQGADCRKIKWG